MIGAIFAGALRERISSDAAVFDYGDKDTFKQFWAETDDGAPLILEGLEGKKRIVIVWDGREDTSDDVTRFAVDLTPLDWALACSLRVLKKSVSAVDGMRMHVIDLTGYKFVSAWAVRMRHQLLVEMPWVSLHAPLIPFNDGDPMRFRRAYSPIVADGTGKSELLSVIEGRVALSDLGKSMSANATADLQVALESLARQWTASLVQGTDHHNVNNFVGPVLLSRLLELPSPPSSDLLDAFAQKLSWMSALPDAAGGEAVVPLKSVVSLKFEEKLAAAGVGGMSVLVVDDELARGWDGVICGFFAKNRGSSPLVDKQFVRLDDANETQIPIQIFGCNHPKPLLNVLSSSPNKRFFERNFELSFIPNNKYAELLVLDLRLFSQAENSASRAYIRDLVTKIRDWGLCRPQNLAWRHIDEREIASVEAWLDGGSKPISPLMEASVITLLPRILALAAPLTPIILFSSTGRADIKEKLKPYRNILTGFSKPQALQDFGAIREAVSEFFTGVETGLNMLAMRSKLAHCMTIADKAERSRENILSRRRNGEAAAHIDFYFDESGSLDQDDFVSASAATIFKDTSAADVLQQHFKNLASNGVHALPVWNKLSKCIGTPLHKFSAFSNRDKDFKQAITILDKGIRESNAYAERADWVSLTVRRYKDQPQQIGNRGLPCLDNQLDLMLRFSVQFNYCVLPRFLGFQEVTCNLYFDRRSIPPTKIDYGDSRTWNEQRQAQELASAKDLKERLGFEITSPPLDGKDKSRNPGGPLKVLMTTYSESSYYPFVREALMGWEPKWMAGVTYNVLRGQQLSECGGGYEERNTKHRELFNRRRWLHDVADWIAGASRANLTNSLEGIFPTRLDTRLDVGLEACLRAARSASWGHADECIHALMENPRIYELKELDPVERILVWVCHDTIRLSSGESLFLLLKNAAFSEPQGEQKQKETSTSGKLRSERTDAVEVGAPALVSDCTVTKPQADPWAAIAQYRASRGFEVLEVAARETIDGQDYWVLCQRNGTEVAVTLVGCEGAGRDRIGCVGLFYTYGDLVTRPGKGGYCVFVLEHWFGDRPDPDGGVGTELMEAASSEVVEDPDSEWRPVTSVDSDQAVLAHSGEMSELALLSDAEGTIEAIVFRVDANNTVVLRSSDPQDRRVYCSDAVNVPSFVRGDRVIIRPRQGENAKFQGYVMSDLVARSSETMS